MSGGVNIELDGQVDRIVIHGVERTHDSLLRKVVCNLFDVTSVGEILRSVVDVRQKLLGLGIFSRVEAIVDVSKIPGDYSYDVTYAVKERNRVAASVRTELDANNAALHLGSRLVNVTGRADHASLGLIRGTSHENGYMASYNLPLGKRLQNRLNVGINRSSCDHGLPFIRPPCAYRHSDLSFYISHEMPLTLRKLIKNKSIGAVDVKYTCRVDHSWRLIETLANQTPPLRLRCLEGESACTSLRHSLEHDTRDTSALPGEGRLLRLSQILAFAPPGDVRFLRHELEAQHVSTLANGYVTLHGTFSAIHALSLGNYPGQHVVDANPLALPDRLFIGGPLTLRGFDFNGVGHCQSSGSQQQLLREGPTIGGTCAWLAALHVYTPLPYLGRPSSADSGGPNPIQLHGFVNAGDLSLSVADSARSLASLASFNRKHCSIRVSIGAGLVVRLGESVRLELNYAVPIRKLQYDSGRTGIQLGFGIQFV